MSNPLLNAITSSQSEHPAPKTVLKTELKVMFNKDQVRRVREILEDNMDNDGCYFAIEPELEGGSMWVTVVTDHVEHPLGGSDIEEESVLVQEFAKRRTGYLKKYVDSWKYKSLILILTGRTKQTLSNQFHDYLDLGRGPLHFSYNYNTRKWHTGYQLKPKEK